MKEKGISENFSFKKFQAEIEGMKLFGKIYRFSNFFGYKNEELDEIFKTVPKIENELKALFITPEKFNFYYSKLGWVASGSMNFDLMKTAVDFAEKNNIAEGEEILIKYFSSEEMKWQLTTLLGDEAFRIRYRYFKLAYLDTIMERYYAAIPLLIMMIDGATNDVTKSKGFFAKNTDLTVWDSIEGHPSGLTALRELLNIGRNFTNLEEIKIPYRNGIIHGRELNFDNRIVVAKCWSALFAIRDWTKSIREGKKEEPVETPKSFKEQLFSIQDTVNDFKDHQQKMRVINSNLENWKKRDLEIGKDVAENGYIENYEIESPERELVTFFELWKSKNYGKIADQIHKYDGYNLRKVPAEVRKYLENRNFKSFKILKIEDTAPAISVIKIEVSYLVGNDIYTKELTFRLICVDKDNNVSCRGVENSRWTFYEQPLLEIQFSL